MPGLRLLLIPSLLFILGLMLSSCGIVRTSTVTTGPVYNEDLEAGAMLQAGIASWYGPNFHGKLTANGESYNMDDFTAAHKTLPFNTIVRVTNRENGKEVDVRINDRGPYVGDRVIDLSRRAADEIDMIVSGTAEVEIWLLEEGDMPVTGSNSSSIETFTVQLSSFDSMQGANAEFQKIRGSEVVPVNVGNRTVYRLYYGEYRTKRDAERAMRELGRRGYNGFVKQREN
jgi:rare lipoprotein A